MTWSKGILTANRRFFDATPGIRPAEGRSVGKRFATALPARSRVSIRLDAHSPGLSTAGDAVRTRGVVAGQARWLPAARRSRHRRRLVALALLAAYAALIVAVVVGSPLDVLDRYIAGLDPLRDAPVVHRGVVLYVLTGQRVPAATAAGIYVAWQAWRRRTWQPIIMFTVALLVLNVTVAAVKYGTGRLGPGLTEQAHTVLAGGTIFPSGHASDAVVVFGVVAMLAPEARRRGAIIVASIAAALVGIGTLLIDTHWVTDVIGAWLAGSLVLLSLPVLTPPAQRVLGPRLDRLGRWVAWGWWRLNTTGHPASPAIARPESTPAGIATRVATGAGPDGSHPRPLVVAPRGTGVRTGC